WTIFPCQGKADFFEQAAIRSRFVRAEWDRYVLFAGETATLTITPSFPDAEVTVAGEPAQAGPDGTFTARLLGDVPGERDILVRADDRTVRTRVLIKEPLEVLLERRCAFIA